MPITITDKNKDMTPFHFLLALTDLSQGREEHFPILVIQENRFPSIAAAEQMIERPIEFYPRHSGHRATICPISITDKNKDMTPFHFLTAFWPSGNNMPITITDKNKDMTPFHFLTKGEKVIEAQRTRISVQPQHHKLILVRVNKT
jgi:hypothetical protein